MENFLKWTNLTKTCYKYNMTCEGCPNDTEFVCRKIPWNKNPYGMKNIKYATLMTLKNIGKPK